MDKARKSYWDVRWENTFLPAAIDPYQSGPDHYLDRKFHDFFREVFSNGETENKRLLEIGCPILRKNLGLKFMALITLK